MAESRELLEANMAPEKESNEPDNYAFALRGPFCDLQDPKHGEEVDSSVDDEGSKLVYSVTDVPPWYLCALLGIQHCLTAFGGIIAIPLILSHGLCLQHDALTQSHLISTIFFVSGLCTLLQVTFGVRLPILQGGTFTLLGPCMAMLSMPEWRCPAWTQNATLVNTSSSEFMEVWQSRMRALQGSIMVGSLLQVVVGFSGLIGIFMRFIGPLTIAPTISLIGLSLFDSAGNSAGNHWGIASLTTALIIVFSQYLRHIPVCFPTYSKDKNLHTCRVYVFQILPVLLGIGLSWLLCYILSILNVLPSDPGQYGYLARTDLKGDVVAKAPWIVFPYPGKKMVHVKNRLMIAFMHTKSLPFGLGQWGMPTVSLAGVVGILAGVISSMIESVGDYHACAKLSGAPPPPKHAINRGIGIEGLGCLLAGAWGTGNGTTSYSENVGALGITKVGSRMVIVAAGIFLIAMGVFGKVGAIFSTIPSPVIGGMFMVMFGVISAAGISTLQYTDLNSSRNIFVFGFSVFSGLVIPNWLLRNPQAISTGVAEIDQLLQVLLTTSMFVGGFFGFLLDNTIPGTKQERGILAWNKAHEDSTSNTVDSEEVYSLPFGLSSYFSSSSWIRYLPFCPPAVPKRSDGFGANATSEDATSRHPEPSHIINGVDP
ncbi:xan_ur_permease domain-containing protein isoform X1 [Nerophis ophidion]|uniref:xan_ur_permease domain-containing protein isoform X1 n=1 Tax=Nerophis ophidion TaxID=159077 RepID=UPI002AE05465|nr:xan_ur_permease domain-containing protein isoform X1 [Nerophis ophidion]